MSKRVYLVGFNVVSALLWANLLFQGLSHLARRARPEEFWAAIEAPLFLTQHLALFEILHSAVGLVGSPLVATAIQVISRVFMLDVFTYPAASSQRDFSLYLMILSWSCVEVPRYSFYAAQLLLGDKGVPGFLFFLRYSLFMVLYPTGITGEILQQVAAYPSFRENDLDWLVRFSHVVIGLVYLPVGPFMVWNMWMMRKRALKKRRDLIKGPAPVRGLVWPITNTETMERSTTEVAKKIFASAARGAKSESGEKVATAVEKERKWRFGYTKHVANHVALSCESSETCLAVAKAGLEAAYNNFKFADGKEEITFAEALKRPAGKKFATGRLKGDLVGEQITHALHVPYKNKGLEGAALAAQCDKWVQTGTIEQSAGDAIKKCSENAAEWMDLSDTVFVMLGATSAMGPLDNLLKHGATVVAIDLKRPQIWKGLFERVQESRGQIMFPLDSEGLSTEKEMIEHAGCDMLQDTLAICDWLDTIVEENSDKKIVCGNYTYLDGALHVQLALAGDAIMQRLCAKSKNVALAFLCTPTDDHVIPQEARQAAEIAFEKNSIWWQKLLTAMGALTPNYNLKPVNNLCIVDGIVSRQGPNYALAKRMQHWRALVARSQGHVVSSNVAPSTATQSVLSNPQFAAGYYGWRYFKPLEVFLQDTSGAVMFALMVNDLRNPYSKANPIVGLPHPLNLFTEQSFHGGIWRCAFSIDSVGVPAALTYYVQTYAPAALGAIAVVAGAVNYIIKGKAV